jgi:uncharacterized protein
LGRGFFAGILWGAVIGAITLALASQLTERRELLPAQPQRAEVEVPGGSEFNQARPETDPVLPAADAPPAAVAPVAVAAPEPAASPPVPADPAPAAPETADAASAPVPAPEVPDVAEVAAPVAEAPASAAVAPDAVEAPAPEVEVAAMPELSPVEAPAAVAQPPAPGAEAVAPTAPAESARAPLPAAPVSVPAAPALPPVVLPGAIAPPVMPAVGDSRIALSTPVDSTPISGAAVAPSPAPADTPPATAAEAPVAPRAEPEVATTPAAPETPPAAAPPVAPPAEPEVAADPPVAAAAEPEVATAPEVPEPAPAAAPSPGFGNAQGVRVNRLPRIGVEEPATGMPAAEVAEAAPVDEDAPALVRNAVAFDNPDLRPVVAIVLLHDRSLAPGAETGRDLSVPVSFAVDAGLVEAGTIADAYRAAGREILLVPTLPPGAAATDVEVALQVNLDVIPEAVALMDLPAGGFQSEREAVAQVVSAITATGHGLVTFPRGLNMADQMASRAGVPTRAVFRMLEPGNTDAALRTLDQAAFRARQEGAVILVGEAEPATVEAIRRWAAANPDGEILLGPVSAALGAAE